MPMSIRILLIITALALFIYAGIRLRTKKGKSWTEIAFRSSALIIFFGVLFYLNSFTKVSNDDVALIEFIMLSILLFGENVYARYQIKGLKAKIHNN